jgi:AcrR family transcriptional regulator
MCNVTSEQKVRLTAMMREVMYEATASVLAEHGVAGMTMERVAAAANTARGSRYHCFADEQDLLQFTHTKTFEPLVAAAKGLH